MDSTVIPLKRTAFGAVFTMFLFGCISETLALNLSDFRKSKGMSSEEGDPLDIRSIPMSQTDEDYISQSPTELNGFITDAKIDDSLYIVGPGDQFQVYIESSTLDKQVNAEGNIVITKIGIIPVAGLNLKAAKKLILERAQAKKIRSQCYVNLSRPKMMKVFVTGAVTLPGIYQVAGNHRVSEAFVMAQGFSSQAQKGPLTVTSPDGTVSQVDLREFFKKGDLKSNPYLTQGAQVHVPYLDFQKPSVTIRRDSLIMTIQLEPDENLDDLIYKLNDYKTPQPFATVIVREQGGSDQEIKPSETRNYRPSNGANIELYSIRREIYVGGAVQRPGFILFHSSHKVLQYISEAGLIVSSKVPDRMTVYGADGTQRTVNVATDALKPGDMVLVNQNAEQKFINYTPILLSIASLSLAIITVIGQRK